MNLKSALLAVLLLAPLGCGQKKEPPEQAHLAEGIHRDFKCTLKFYPDKETSAV